MSRTYDIKTIDFLIRKNAERVFTDKIHSMESGYLNELKEILVQSSNGCLDAKARVVMQDVRSHLKDFIPQDIREKFIEVEIKKQSEKILSQIHSIDSLVRRAISEGDIYE